MTGLVGRRVTARDATGRRPPGLLEMMTMSDRELNEAIAGGRIVVDHVPGFRPVVQNGYLNYYRVTGPEAEPDSPGRADTLPAQSGRS